MEHLGRLLNSVRGNLQKSAVDAKQVEQFCKPISEGLVPLELDCTAPRGSHQGKGIHQDEEMSPVTKTSDQALKVDLERDGKKLKVKLDVPDILARAPSRQQNEILKTVHIQGLSLEVIKKPVALTKEALERLLFVYRGG